MLNKVVWTCVQVRNEQCQEMAQSDDQKWITSNGEWDTHTVSMWCVCVCL